MTTEEFIWFAYFYVNVIILVNGSINGSTWIPNMLEPRWILDCWSSYQSTVFAEKWNDAAIYV